MTIGSEEVVPPPIAPGQYALGNVASGLNLDAPGNESTQVRTSSPSTAATQKWVLTQHDDGSVTQSDSGAGNQRWKATVS